MSNPGSNELDWFGKAVKRVKHGEAAALITETRAALNRQPDRIEHQLTLAMAHSWLGSGNEAEPYARQALDTVRQHGLNEKGSYWFPRYLDMAHLAVHDALMQQGRFQDAARFIEDYADIAVRTNMMLACAELNYYLVGDSQTASRLRNKWVHYDPYSGNTPPSEQHNVPEKYMLILTYLQANQAPPGPQRSVGQLLWQIRITDWGYTVLRLWEDEVLRNAHNPYGARLSPIVAAMVAQRPPLR